ncbi:dihydrolipoamide acetyltransferase family protein [Natrinema halophilum]|uniref:dihydrolipoamide acetyltransferase family protein n=1 Tax=Natrinema halophilum TaxID=1699371 RepID=UPI001F3AF91D|nr:dihydrolipoamide acetyltransferase family protein [Natrinema halophilum]UHQ96324.1 2-oxo acid dehydrogenase subunit E2 [Natrinema halophilum]
MTEFKFRLPDVGEGITEAEIANWNAELGDEVETDDLLLEIETDKALVEITSPCPGEITEIRFKAGETANVGDVIAVIETENPPEQIGHEDQDVGGQSADDAAGDTATDAAGTGANPGTTAEGAAAQQASADNEPVARTADEGTDNESGVDGRVFAAPHTRRFARENDVDLTAVSGTGPGGRVTRGDVEAHLQQDSSTAEVQSDTVGGTDDPAPASSSEDVVRTPMRGLRKTIADNMAESKSKIPHVSSGYMANASEFMSLKDRLDDRYDTRITYTALMVKAVIPALQEFPELNASIDDEAGEIVEKHYYNIGVATHTEDGLIVPVIHDADEKSIVEIARELETVVESARERSLDTSDITDGTFTITNTGSHRGHGRSTFGTPIINYPQTAILGMNAIRNEAVPVNDTDVEVQKCLPLTVSYDHRLIDGVTGAEFMSYVIENVENKDVFLSRL